MHTSFRCIPLACLITLGAASRLPAADPAFTAEAIALFERKIRPLLVESCYECHAAGARKIKGDLRVDSRAAMIKGGESGTSLTPGDPAKSRLIEAVTYKNADLQMPPKKKLSDEAIADLTRWVQMGAPWPAEAAPGTTPPDAKPAVDYEARKREHWAWQPVKNATPPKVKNENWVRNEIDRFILAKLEEKNLSPSRQADPRALIRRVTFDLIGLPPTPEEVDAFVKEWEKEGSEFRVRGSGLKGTATTRNPEPGTRNSAAYSRLVDRLLATPQYGERWARHWLDVVRYADSKDARGQGGDVDIPFAYRYRDWVIDAFNRDLPYDQFISQQIAGDLLRSSGFRVPGSGLKNDLSQTGSPNSEPGTRNPEPSAFSPLIATTMLAIGNWETGCSDKRKMMTDIVDDQVDVISRGFLGMTVACARCHDHKFDPITTRDYYALAGFFFSSHIIPAPGDPTAGTAMLRVPLMSAEQIALIRGAQASVEEIKKQINEQVDLRRREVVTRELARIKSYLAAAAELHQSDRRSEASTLSTLAAKHGVHAAMLKRFVRYFGMAGHGDTVRGLFTTKLSDVMSNKQISGWGSPDTPMVIAHTGREAARVLTFTLPPRSLAMHPSPTRQVAIGWRSKIAGTVSITGHAADADPNCGNGFDWSIVRKRGPVTTRLAAGSAENGTSHNFAQSSDAKGLEAVPVEPGDLISLVIDAKGKAHECDTTAIDLVIRETTGRKREWNLTADAVDSILQSNPHPDAHGNREVWYFYAIATGTEEDDSGAAVPPGSVLAKWLALVTDPKREPMTSETKKTLAELAASIERLAASGLKAPADRPAPDIALHRDLMAVNGAVWSTIDLLAYTEMDAGPLDALKTKLAEQTRIAATKIEFAQSIQEGGVPGSEHAGIRDAKVHIRGRYDRLGDVVPRGFPALIAATPQAAISGGSGRVELAKWIASPDNPMTARVMMNRLWQHHFGRGIVATPDNFGHLGDRPSHPELLDHLAIKFVESGWSIKAMHKLIVTSATYMQESGRHEGTEPRRHEGSDPTPDTRHPTPDSTDPDNRLLWRQNRQRLDAEQLRDALLTAAGQIDRGSTLAAGPATADLNSPRRTVYLMAVRSDTSNYRTLFDAADPNTSIHARNESTVAPQALFMLNHPFALAMTDAVSKRLLREGPKEDEKRIAWLYERLFARPATLRELAIGLRIVRDDASGDAAGAWKQYVQVLLCANEFVYLD